MRSLGPLVFFWASCGISIAQPPPKALEFTVRKHPSITTINLDDIRAILSRAADYINAECGLEQSNRGRAKQKKSSPQGLSFNPKNNLSDITPLDDASLRGAGYTDGAIRAVRESERTGLYGRQAVESLMAAANRAEGLQINIVQKIVAPCPSEVLPFTPAKQRSDVEGDYPWLGCSETFGRVTVLRLTSPKETTAARYRRWVDHEAALWAHEIAHLLGLDDLEQALRSALPGGRRGSGWLMMHPYNSAFVQLLAPECEVIKSYPNNEAQRRTMREYVQKVSPSSPSGKE